MIRKMIRGDAPTGTVHGVGAVLLQQQTKMFALFQLLCGFLAVTLALDLPLRRGSLFLELLLSRSRDEVDTQAQSIALRHSKHQRTV